MQKKYYLNQNKWFISSCFLVIFLVGVSYIWDKSHHSSSLKIQEPMKNEFIKRIEQQGIPLKEWNIPFSKEEVAKIICCNANFPWDDVIVTEREKIDRMVEQLSEIPFSYNGKIPEPPSDPNKLETGGSCQLLIFYGENDQELEAIEVKRDTELRVNQGNNQ